MAASGNALVAALGILLGDACEVEEELLLFLRCDFPGRSRGVPRSLEPRDCSAPWASVRPRRGLPARTRGQLS